MSKSYRVKDRCGEVYFYKDIHCSIFHNENGPAIIREDSSEGWYQDGELHRENGPAVTYVSGKNFWWYRGKYIADNQKDFERYLKIAILE